MNIDEKELKSLIRRVTEQVVRRLLEPEKTEQGALVIAPSFLPDPEPLKEYLKEKYGASFKVTGEGAQALGCEFNAVCAETQQEKQRFMGTLKNYADILLVSPPLGMLRNIARGDDSGFFEQAFMRALLWGKNVTVVLDFEKPDFKRGTFFESLSDSLSAIEDMGAEVVSLKLSVGKMEGQLSLVTEAEVSDAHKKGREHVTCAPGAIVTPLARDAAKELGIEIQE